MVNFFDIVELKVSGCPKCFSITYVLPCQVDTNIVTYLKKFGKPLYPISASSLIKIDATDGIHIESRVGAKVIKLTMPKKYSTYDIKKIDRKNEFEKKLVGWMVDKLQMQIVWKI